MERVKIPIDDVPAATDESKPVIYDAIKAGHLKTFLVGRRRFTRPEYVREWVDFLESESNAGRPVCYRKRERRAA